MNVNNLSGINSIESGLSESYSLLISFAVNLDVAGYVKPTFVEDIFVFFCATFLLTLKLVNSTLFSPTSKGFFSVLLTVAVINFSNPGILTKTLSKILYSLNDPSIRLATSTSTLISGYCDGYQKGYCRPSWRFSFCGFPCTQQHRIR